VTSIAYPEADWPESRRNAHFAAAAKAYDEERNRGKLRFKLTPFAEFKLDEHAPYLVKGLLPRSGLAVVWGPPKCGKSFWAFDLLMHVALGWEYRGHRVVSGPIVYCALEGAEGFRKRIEAFRQAKLAEGDASPPFYLMTAPLGLVQDANTFLRDLRTQLSDQKPVAVCIDTLNRSLAGSESSDEDMAAYIRAADAIRDAFGFG
jgi:RecA-family ATPase